MNQNWRLDDERQTLVLTSRNDGMPSVIYWGGALPEDENLNDLSAATELDLNGGMLDRLPDLSLCPLSSQTFPGQPGLKARSIEGVALHPSFHLVAATTTDHTVSFTCQDSSLGLTYKADFVSDPDTNILTSRASLVSDNKIVVEWLAAPVLPAPQLAKEMIDFSGAWIGEFRENITPWAPGIRLRENLTGRTGHEHFPGLILPCLGATNTQGQAYALHYGWSGGHRMLAEELPDGRRQVQFGHAAGSQPAGTHFETAPLYACYSNTGLNGCTVAFQRHLRDRIVPWTKNATARPVHYNCWEAIYFDHSLETLKDIASRAAALGAERFVLDDGWFGKRDDDTSSLGDWTIDTRKWPDGLGPLIDHIHSQGMDFGLWFEPEMINTDSDLFRAHPNWVLGAADQISGRHQLVLNMALPKVRDYLYDKIAALLTCYAIAYLKWDHNRVLPVPDATQAQGTYALLDRLRRTFPTVEIESCASGGGRIDFAILARTQRVWLSDSNDAIERQRIQHAAALFLPAAVTGSHVGPRHCHTSGRILDISFRAWTAAQRHMGFEMNPQELTKDDASTLSQVTRWWKDNRDWTMMADILRLDPADEQITAEQQMAQDGSRFVVFAAQTGTSVQTLPRPLRLTGLKTNAKYRISLKNTADAPTRSRASIALKTGPITLSGAALMHHGLSLPCPSPASLWIIEGSRL